MIPPFRFQTICRRKSLRGSMLLGNRVLIMAGMLLLMSCGNRSQQHQVSLIELPTREGYSITGQIDFPDGGEPRFITVLVAGTGPFDRDVYFGTSGSVSELTFLELSLAFTRSGSAVVRTDKRGILYDKRKNQIGRENIRKAGGWLNGDVESPWFDETALSSVSSSSGVEDLSIVIEFVRQKFPTLPIVIVAHSEGVLIASKYLESNSVDLLVAICGPMESPKSLIEWQYSDRIADSMLMMDLNNDTIVTNEEVKKSYHSVPAAVLNNINMFLSHKGQFDRTRISNTRRYWTEMYQKERKKALSQDPSIPFYYGSSTVIFSSYDWWQQWFIDDRPVADRLANYPGKKVMIYGESDGQVPYGRQLAVLEQTAFKSEPTIIVLEGGHTLGSHVVYGPISRNSIKRIVSATQSAMLELNKTEN